MAAFQDVQLTMIVPFEKLSPKHYDFTTYQGLDANFEGGRGRCDPGSPSEHLERMQKLGIVRPETKKSDKPVSLSSKVPSIY